MRVEADLQLRIRSPQFVEDPLPRRADAARRRRSVGERIARTEGHERSQQLLHPTFGNGTDEFRNPCIGVRRTELRADTWRDQEHGNDGNQERTHRETSWWCYSRPLRRVR